MSNRLDATNCTHEAALARVAELESKLANAERDFQESYASAGKWQGLAVEYKSKLERASKFANANAEDVESLQGKVRELESLCSSQALRLSSIALWFAENRSGMFTDQAADLAKLLPIVVEKQTSDPFVESAKQRCSHCGNYVPCGCWPTV